MEQQKKHLCSICGKNYSSRQSLYNHKKRIHTIVDNIFPHFSTLNTTQIHPQYTPNIPSIYPKCIKKRYTM